MFYRSPVIMTCSQFAGEESDVQVLRVTLNTGTGHAVSRGTTVKGCAIAQGNAVGGGSRETFAAKTYMLQSIRQRLGKTTGS
jgi:hypothetical protein